MLTGAPPFRRDDDLALLWAHQYDTPPPATELRPQLPQAVDTVLARALSKTPQERYDSCLEFVAALRAACSGARAQQERHPATQVVAAPRRHRSGIGVRSDQPPPPPHWAWPVYAPDDKAG
jgi:serine/threonine-protein kinase